MRRPAGRLFRGCTRLAYRRLAGRDPARLNRRDFNQHVIAGHARAGQGMFIAALRRHLRHRRVDVPFHEISRPAPHGVEPDAHTTDAAGCIG